jgi:farnesyl-diphosphate farnesyltransferase
MDFGETADRAYQEWILPQVSRTFALTIPQLPEPLRTAVANAYVLCRIADTIEDDPAIPAADTWTFLERLTAVVMGAENAAPLAQEVARRLSDCTLPAERELVVNLERVIGVTLALGEQRAAIQRCIQLMSHGMHHFQRTVSLAGLPRSSDLDSYCYYVAGVVGEMLTELFCWYSPAIATRRDTLPALAVSFAQGLQMTNILKDFWEDRSGARLAAADLFARHGVELAALTPQNADARFHAGMRELIGVAHGHLHNALEYTLLIPGKETGIRRFCLWAIGLAVLTLRKIAANPQFTCGAQVKVSRTAVVLTQLCTSSVVRNDRLLRFLFERASGGLTSSLAVRRAEVPGEARESKQLFAAPVERAAALRQQLGAVTRPVLVPRTARHRCQGGRRSACNG